MILKEYFLTELSGVRICLASYGEGAGLYTGAVTKKYIASMITNSIISLVCCIDVICKSSFFGKELLCLLHSTYMNLPGAGLYTGAGAGSAGAGADFPSRRSTAFVGSSASSAAGSAALGAAGAGAYTGAGGGASG